MVILITVSKVKILTWILVTFALVIIVNSSVINEIKLFDPYICFFMFDVFHVLTFIQFQTLYRFLEDYTQTGA
ncbi:hypothetical protein Hanom_Chr06g00548201 [Helianthus anomalus]